MIELLKYGDIRLRNITAERPEDWDESGCTHMRVELPAETANELEMSGRGFFLADRTLGVSINLANSRVDYGSYVRMNIIETSDYKEDILRIASSSFLEDRRFHIAPELNDNTAKTIIEAWARIPEKYFVCLYKDVPVGFLALAEMPATSAFVYLAAVEEKYRSAGAALSLYASAAEFCRKKGYKRLEGRVSSRNAPVMNLYAFLGGKFNAPIDVYLKETANEP